MIKKISLMVISLLFSLNVMTALKGTGNVITEKRDVPIFHSVNMEGIGHALIQAGPSGPLVVTADANIMDILITKVEKGVLYIKTSRLVTEANKLEILITMDTINMITLSGSGRIDVEKTIDTEKIVLQVQGSGNIMADLASKFVYTTLTGSGSLDLYGTSVKHEIDINGSGEVNCLRLITEEAKVSITGTGTAKINATQKIDAELTGGVVQYINSPQINLKASAIGGGFLNYIK